VIGENRLRTLLEETPPAQVPARVHDLLGSAWDDAWRRSATPGDGAPVTWLHQVG
jgi:hypothetical protein